MEGKIKRIGIYLGSFDPIHIGHVNTIIKVLNENLVDYVLIVPCAQNPWKDHKPVSLEKRRQMIRLLDIDIVGKVGVSDCDSKIKPDENGEYYAYQSLELIKEEIENNNDKFDDEPELSIIAGTDVALDIPKWKNSEWILSNFKVINIDRPGYSVYDDFKGINISSTDIRDMIKKGLNPIPWVPAEVWHYIKEEGLYKK